MTKWELAELMGAELTFNPASRNHFNTTVAFGSESKHFHSDEHVDKEYAAELVFGMIRKAVEHSRNVWGHS